MRFEANLSALCIALLGAQALVIEDGCPKDEYACIDVINSSQCIEQLAVEHLRPLTKASLAACVEYEGVVSDLPGGTKVGMTQAE